MQWLNEEAAKRDLSFLKDQFYREVGCETNDVVTLFSYWQSNYSQQKHKHEETSFDNKTDFGAVSGLRKETVVFPRGLEASSSNATHQIGEE